MPKEETLGKIEHDIKSGDLGKARDRLHGLIQSYPNDLALRPKLAEVYQRVQFPQMAGRYWYLVENPTDAMQAAILAFEISSGHDAVKMLHAIKFRGDKDQLPDYAQERLRALEGRALSVFGAYPIFGPGKSAKWKHGGTGNVRNKALGCGCIALLVGSIVLALTGLIVIVSWLWGLFAQ